ncbi:MAG: RnfABCDGE type electron transport complex subunit B [Gammaproteobacteria bacterium]
MPNITPEQIDEILPQTQCGLCSYGGCMPYAEAMVYEQAPINLCPPGGLKTLNKLGTLLNQDPTPYQADMSQKAKPPLIAVIREAECIGCTKCIQACPIDAILGGAKQMHTVIAPECTGCELCVSPCPVDCIDLIPLAPSTNEATATAKANQARIRFQSRLARLQQEKLQSLEIKEKNSLSTKKSYIEEALARAKAKKQNI